MPSEFTSSIGRFGLIAAGGYAFGPIGAAAGALLGGFLFGSSGPKIEGPRLGDLDVSSSAYGGVIPLGFGVQKVAGTIIWATDIDEDKNTRKEGGSLFGGGQKIVEYRYFANFAAAFGEGPAGGVLRIWAGDRLIADLRAGAGAYANHPKYSFRIYLGTEDREPDRLIRQHVENSNNFDGEDATPAYRGLVYIVFEDLPLDEFGNRIPPITAEISWDGAAQAVVNDTAVLSALSYSTSFLALNSVRGQFYFRKTSAPASLARVRIPTTTEEVRVPESEISGGNAFGPQVVDPDGNIYGTIGVTQSAFIKVNGDTLQNAGQVSFSSETQLDIVSAYTLAGADRLRVGARLPERACAHLLRREPDAVLGRAEHLTTRPRGVVAGISEFGFCEAWFAGAPSIVLGAPTATVSILHVRLELPFAVNPITSTPATVKPTTITLTAASLGASQMTIGNLCYDEQNDRSFCSSPCKSACNVDPLSRGIGVQF